MSIVEIVLLVETSILIIVVILRRERRPKDCYHCYHWLGTLQVGQSSFEVCCRCGRGRVTYVLAAPTQGTIRVSEHGEYAQYHSARDRTIGGAA